MVRSRRGVETFRRVVLDAPVSYSVFSAFSYYGARRGNELAGTWLVAALTTLGHEVAAVRQTLYRMEASDQLTGRSLGRNKFYRLTPGARADAEAGLAKIMAPAAGTWDGRWTIVQTSDDDEARSGKELVREVLRAEGFARVGPNLFVHPRDRTTRLMHAAHAHHVAELLTIFRGERIVPVGERDFAERTWDLAGIDSGYRAFLTRYAMMDRHASRLDDREAFTVRFALVFDYLETAWLDPDLPTEILPRDWPGPRARGLAQSLYRHLLPQALAFGDRLATKAQRGTSGDRSTKSRTAPLVR